MALAGITFAQALSPRRPHDREQSCYLMGIFEDSAETLISKPVPAPPTSCVSIRTPMDTSLPYSW